MSIELSNDTIRFRGSFRPQHFGFFLDHMQSLLLGKPRQLVLDFLNCTEAFPNTMLPTIAMVARFRIMDYQIYATLPSEPIPRERFISSNWAHYLSPQQYSLSDDMAEPHLVCRHYKTAKEHYAILNGIIDLIIKTVRPPRSALSMLEWVINEIMDNVINHSESQVGGFVQLAIFPPSKKFAICVVDSGRGILNSLNSTARVQMTHLCRCFLWDLAA